ncbi:MAG: SDR family NAD(P)-dependent oxidoreductase, partial [Aurantimicrobium sp.]
MTFTVAGTRILITGAAMGMGRLYAERAVAEGAETVILWDINKEALSDTTKALRVHADNTQEIVPMLVDIGQRTAIEKAAANVMENHGGVDIIINNAGVVRGTYFWEHENERDTEFIMKINALAPMFITHEFLNGMISGKRPSRI